ncbi:MAG: hypothetical protein HY074_07360 [Deltaproteobacteria bacterium]|nr:hypothetical protein [Deltaproteobacteria bacterium]
MKQLFVLIFLLLALGANTFAAPLVRIQTEPVNGIALEVSATEATDSQQLESAANWVEQDLAGAKSQNAGITPQAVVAEPDSAGAPEVRAFTPDLAPSGKLTLRKKLNDLLDRHYRVSFTLIRGVANTGVVSWGLILSSHVSLLSALPVGIVAGSMSAGFQFFNQGYQAWMLKSKTTVGRLGRSLFTNTIYLAIAKFTAFIAGAPVENNLLLATGTVLKSAFLGTLAQGTWNLGIAENARIRTEQVPANDAKIRRANDFKTLTISMISTALSVANLAGAPLTDAAMLTMAGTGSVYYAWVALKARKWAREKPVQEARARLCEQQLLP